MLSVSQSAVSVKLFPGCGKFFLIRNILLFSEKKEFSFFMKTLIFCH